MRKIAALLIAPALVISLASAPAANAATGEIQLYRVLTTNYWSPIGSLGNLVNQIPLGPF